LAEEETELRLAQDRGEAGGQRALLVAGWNNDREFQVG